MMNKVDEAIHSVGLGRDFDLPRIAVVGAQSTGKSSILESVIGEDFLPRGAKMATKCPLILQLIHTDDEVKYAVFSDEDRKIEDFKEIKDKIAEKSELV